MNVEVAGDAVRRVRLQPPIDVQVGQTVIGQPPHQAIELIAGTFGHHRAAHNIAATQAIENALEVSVDVGERRFREARLRAERVAEHAFHLFVAWPGLIGAAPQSGALRQLREAITGLWATGTWRLATALVDWGQPRSTEELVRWAHTSDSLAARLIRYLLDHELAGVGQSDVALAPTFPSAWLAQEALRDPEFALHPQLDGAPLEVGPLAHWSHHPLVADVLHTTGGGLLARFVARLAALCDDVDWLAGAQRLRQVKPHHYPIKSGIGAGVVETMCGPLAHVVELMEGRVASWTTVAPARWNFHPQGVLASALIGSSASGLQARTRWLVAGLDPCVTCQVVVRGLADA